MKIWHAAVVLLSINSCKLLKPKTTHLAEENQTPKKTTLSREDQLLGLAEATQDAFKAYQKDRAAEKKNEDENREKISEAMDKAATDIEESSKEDLAEKITSSKIDQGEKAAERPNDPALASVLQSLSFPLILGSFFLIESEFKEMRIGKERLPISYDGDVLYAKSSDDRVYLELENGKPRPYFIGEQPVLVSNRKLYIRDKNNNSILRHVDIVDGIAKTYETLDGRPVRMYPSIANPYAVYNNDQELRQYVDLQDDGSAKTYVDDKGRPVLAFQTDLSSPAPYIKGPLYGTETIKLFVKLQPDGTAKTFTIGDRPVQTNYLGFPYVENNAGGRSYVKFEGDVPKIILYEGKEALMSSKGDAYYAVGKNKFLLDVSSLPAKPYLIDDSVDGKEAKRNVNINASGDYEFDKWNGKEYEKVAVEIKEGVLEIPDKSKPKLDDIVFNSPNRKNSGHSFEVRRSNLQRYGKAGGVFALGFSLLTASLVMNYRNTGVQLTEDVKKDALESLAEKLKPILEKRKVLLGSSSEELQNDAL